MKMSRTQRTWIRRVGLTVLIVELAWLVLINGALNLGLTQTLINKIRPNKFHISWDSGWSWYPGQVRLQGVFTNGQSRTQQWQVSADWATGHVMLLPLILRRVWITGAETGDVDFRLRPRFKPGRDYSQALPYFPDIEGWSLTDTDETPRKKKRPWHISAKNLEVAGDITYWIWQIQGGASGVIEADLTYVSRGGDLSLDGKTVDLELHRTVVNGDREVLSNGSVSGSVGFVPFNPREQKGLPMLDYLQLDLDLNIDMNRLSFINVFLLDIPSVRVGGKGRVNGPLRFDRGWVLEGTDLVVDASDLAVAANSLNIAGAGTVRLKLEPDTDNRLDLAFQYRGLEVRHQEDSAPMLTGQDLGLTIGGDARLLPDPEQFNPSRTIGFTVNDLTVPDLALLQRYLPEKWPFILHGGEGILSGSGRLTPGSLALDLGIRSERADMGLRQYRFETNLDAVLKANNPSLTEHATDVSGSYMNLSESRLGRAGKDNSERWSTSFTIRDGYFQLLAADQKASGDHVVDLLEVLGNQSAKELLGNSAGVFEFESSMSSLAWLAVLFGDKFDTRIAGSGELLGTAHLAAGLPQPGTDIRIQSDSLSVNVLDYVSTGDGRIDLRVEEGGAAPDWFAAIALSNAEMKRPGRASADIREVEMTLDALIQDVTFEQKDRPFTLNFRIPSAKVVDMTLFNGLMPPDAPVALTGGTAELTADIALKHDDADGYVRLRSRALEAVADRNAVQGDLEADVLLVGGTPSRMVFDISGSELRLDNVRVSGETTDFEGGDWSTVINLSHGETTWSDPPRLDAEATLPMSDSRPFVALFNNQDGWRPKWLSEMLTIENVAGVARVQMADDVVVIPFARLLGDTVELNAKAVIDGDHRDGMVYARYKKVDAAVKMEDGRKSLVLIKPREKFETYRLPPR
jgi:hypothetical protein